MFHEGRVSCIPNANAAKNKAARLSAGARQMLCISQIITDAWAAAKTDRRDVEKMLRNDQKQRCARPFSAALCFSLKTLRRPTAVGVSLFSGASDLVAVFVHAPTLAGAAMALGWFKVAFVCASREVGA